MPEGAEDIAMAMWARRPAAARNPRIPLPMGRVLLRGGQIPAVVKAQKDPAVMCAETPRNATGAGDVPSVRVM